VHSPSNVPKRFTTQMYVYFVHLKETNNPSIHATSDEVETLAPEYRPAHAWLDAARSGEVILFPPQFILLWHASRYLDSQDNISSSSSAEEIVERRRRLYEFITSAKQGGPAWSDMFISPIGKGMSGDGRSYLGLESPGPELKDSQLRGDTEYVVMVKFNKEGPRQLEVRKRAEVFEEERLRRQSEQDGKGKL
jgi:hypothetical protein